MPKLIGIQVEANCVKDLKSLRRSCWSDFFLASDDFARKGAEIM